ncbi:putative eukaryotic translation initiation factor 3 subunit [Trypanosoma conorhini]|uniref:Putative eukaryotic translation initiation factor 3 subunit n=1 Tax=Trypanosoma conorhini TaxID=83891 RepID=A0A422QAR5_9TRYP|nr:putative eukaryotic translation initiation factor 3 subunit [Trypanosoma conorhini]RNF27047.1 putative eukaryotic translation initiation factor 3 subunit [Trypanosoma conorhini]
MVTEITVLTFNLWGIFNSKHRAARMEQFATKVAHYDVILLQEQFSEKDFELILSRLPSEVRETRFFRRFPSAFYGSGVAVISRFPIKSALFFTFPLQGYPERVFHGDYYANKGASLVRLSVPRSAGAGAGPNLPCDDVSLYSTHLVAAYEKTARLSNWRDELYLSVRLSQAVSLAGFISETSHPSARVIIGGDFNATQRSLELRTMLILLRQRGYKFLSVLPPSIVYRPEMSEQERRINTATLTFSDANAFNSTKEGWLVQGGDVPCQIDHMFFTANTLCLTDYNDCPDAPADYPFRIPIDGVEKPAGVVVFTGNKEVQLPPERGTWVKACNALAAVGNAIRCGPLASFARRLAPEQGGNKSEARCCPISDHYGVAARFKLEEEEGSTAAEHRSAFKVGEAGMKLTEAETELLREAAGLLEDSVKRLLYESRLCILFSAALATLVVGHLLYMEFEAQLQEKHTGQVLKELFAFGNLQGRAARLGGLLPGGDFNNLRRWLRVPVPGSSDNFPVATGVKPQSAAPDNAAIDYADMASRLHARSFSSFLSPFLTIFGSLLSAASLATALLQRKADAKVLAEQVAMLKQVPPDQNKAVR